MAEGSDQPDWLQLSSFDAQSFFSAQQQLLQQQQRLQAAHLQAVADYLLPSSSEEDSDSGSKPGSKDQAARASGTRGSEGTGGRGRQRTREEGKRHRSTSSGNSISEGSSRGRGRSRGKRKRHNKEREKRKDSKRSKHKRGARSDREKIVRAEQLGGEAQRAQQVKGWATAEQASKEPFYFDSRGDPGNIAFGGLYRTDVALYRRHDPAGYAASLGARGQGSASFRGQLPSEADGHVLRRERDPRYYSAALLRLEHSARLRRWHRWQHAAGRAQQRAERQQAAQQAVVLGGLRGQLNLPGTNFIPLATAAEEETGNGGHMGATAGPPSLGSAGLGQGEDRTAGRQQQQGETREEYVLRRTREFNAATRERAFELQLWLDFAQFQDEAVRVGHQRRAAASERAAAEKKIAILERALTHHPGSDQLLLALLDAARPLCTEAEMEGRWRRVLARHGGSPQLWQRYLQYRRSHFSGFNAGEVAGLYLEALQAMHRERQRRTKQGAPPDVVAGVEAEMASLALGWCGLQLQSGHTERGVAGIQALVEYHLFAPAGWGEAAKREMFQDYWESRDPLLGELGGGRGWAGWLAGVTAADVGAEGAAQRAQQEQRRRRQEEDAAQEEQRREEVESWSGWLELAPALEAQKAEQGEEAAGRGSGSEEEDEGEGREEDVVLEEGEVGETEEELLERLGMSLDAALGEASSNLTPPVLSAWLGMEAQRDAAQWQPQRAGQPSSQAGEDVDMQAAGDEGVAAGEAARVKFRDVSPLLLSLDSEAAVRQVVMGSLLLLGAPLLGLLGSSDPAVASGAAASDEIWQAAIWVAEGMAAPAALGAADSQQQQLTWFLRQMGSQSSVREPPWYQAHPSRHQFLLRLLAALVQGPCKDWAPLLRALLLVACQTLQEPRAPPSPQACPAPQAEAAAGQGRVGWGWAAGRTLAKQLLSGQRESLALWGAYAELERWAGNLKAARKVYQTCMGSAAASPAWPKAKPAATLVLAAAQLELHAAAAGTAAGAAAGPALSASAATSGAAQAALAARALFSASPEAAGAAARLLAWLGSAGSVPPAAAAAVGGALTVEQVVAARKGYQGLLFSVLEQGRMAFDQGSCDLVACAAMFELVEPLASRGTGAAGAGARAAIAIYEQVVSALQGAGAEQAQQLQLATPAAAAAAIERLCEWRGAVQVEASTRGLACAPPRVVRAALLRALGWFPASAGLMQLLLAHELAGHRVAQLRRDFRELCMRHPTLQAWLAALGVELWSHAPPSSLAGVLERAVGSEALRHCPLLWRCYARLEASRQRPDAVRRVFLRGVGACPWDKALWLDGVALLNSHAPPKELAEYLEIVKDKDLLLRTDVYEVLLVQLEGTLAA